MVTITVIFLIDSFLIVFVLRPDPKKEGLIIDKEATIEI